MKSNRLMGCIQAIGLGAIIVGILYLVGTIYTSNSDANSKREAVLIPIYFTQTAEARADTRTAVANMTQIEQTRIHTPTLIPSAIVVSTPVLPTATGTARQVSIPVTPTRTDTPIPSPTILPYSGRLMKFGLSSSSGTNTCYFSIWIERLSEALRVGPIFIEIWDIESNSLFEKLEAVPDGGIYEDRYKGNNSKPLTPGKTYFVKIVWKDPNPRIGLLDNVPTTAPEVPNNRTVFVNTNGYCTEK